MHHGVHSLETTLAVDDGQRVQIAVDIRRVHVHQVGVYNLVGVLRWAQSALVRLLSSLGYITGVTRKLTRKDPILQNAERFENSVQSLAIWVSEPCMLNLGHLIRHGLAMSL